VSNELKGLVKGLIVGTGIVGAGGILIGTSWVPGVELLLLAVIANITVNKLWSKNE
jgi:hypothetical protein